jgi:hypothetical protein
VLISVFSIASRKGTHAERLSHAESLSEDVWQPMAPLGARVFGNIAVPVVIGAATSKLLQDIPPELARLEVIPILLLCVPLEAVRGHSGKVAIRDMSSFSRMGPTPR